MLVTRAATPSLRFDPSFVAQRERDVERDFRQVFPFLHLHSVVLEIGAGDCALSRRLAGDAERVYALDVCEDSMGRLGGPPNLVRRAHDGVRIPVPADTIDVAFSRHVVISQLPGICRALRDGGVYVTTSPGPAAELRAAFMDAGFSGVRFHVGGVRVPFALARALDDRFRITAVK